MAAVTPLKVSSSNGVLAEQYQAGDFLPYNFGGTGQVAVTAGDVLYGSALNTWSRLGIGTAGHALVVSGGVPAWAVLGVVGGGTGIATYTAGDLLYASGVLTLAKLGIGTAGQVLTVSGGLPAWAAAGTITHQRAVTSGDAGTITKGFATYIKSDGTVARAQANSTTTCVVYGLAVADITASGSGNVYVDGEVVLTTGEWDAVTGGTGGLTRGQVYYLDAATAGKLTATKPSSAGQQQVPVGLAKSTTAMELQIGGGIVAL